VPLARLPSAASRTVLALAAVVHFGAGGIYRPVESAEGPARHPHVNYAFFRDTGALSAQLLAGLAPWCDSLRAMPRTFAAGVPPGEVFESAFGPGLRVTCRDTAVRVRFLAEFAPDDASSEFAVLRFDARSGQFALERADARVRARVGEGFLIHARFDVAAACFESVTGAPDRELTYPTTVALAAAGRERDARARWAEATARGAVLDPATMAGRLSGAAAGGSPGGDAAAALTPLAAAVLRAPGEAAPHRVLGQALLDGGRAREAAFELAVAAGIARGNDDLARLAPAYEAMGLLDEAIAAYRRALDGGLREPLYGQTRDRFMALMRRTRAEAGP
jgi:tetratricopeptide (TPR) repeat protein